MKIIQILAMVIAAGLLVACNSTQTPVANNQAPNNNVLPERQPVQQTPPPGQTNPLGDATSGFKAALGARPQFKVTYDVKSSSQGQNVASTMTQYYKNPTTIRNDITASGFTFESFILSGVVTTCNNAAGSWTCTQSQAQQTPDQQIAAGTADYTVVADGSMTVAGVGTTCYKTTTANATMRWCFSSDHIPLYMNTATAQSTTELTATSFSTSVSDADFVPPQSTSDGNSPQLPAGYNVPQR